jgi:hypothetical protein
MRLMITLVCLNVAVELLGILLVGCSNTPQRPTFSRVDETRAGLSVTVKSHQSENPQHEGSLVFKRLLLVALDAKDVPQPLDGVELEALRKLNSFVELGELEPAGSYSYSLEVDYYLSRQQYDAALQANRDKHFFLLGLGLGYPPAGWRVTSDEGKVLGYQQLGMESAKSSTLPRPPKQDDGAASAGSEPADPQPGSAGQ